jgi:hypothetical protein
VWSSKSDAAASKVGEIALFRGEKSLILCIPRKKFRDEHLLSFKAPLHVKLTSTVRAQVDVVFDAKPSEINPELAAGSTTMARMVKARYFASLYVHRGQSHYLLLTHSSAETPTGKISASVNWHQTRRPRWDMAVWSQTGGQTCNVLCESLLEIWFVNKDGRPQSEIVVAICPLRRRPVDPTAHVGLHVFERAHASSTLLVPLHDLAVIRHYHTPILYGVGGEIVAAELYVPQQGEKCSFKSPLAVSTSYLYQSPSKLLGVDEVRIKGGYWETSIRLKLGILTVSRTRYCSKTWKWRGKLPLAMRC